MDRNDTLQVKCTGGKCGRTFELKVNSADVKAWRGGTLIQKAMPYLTADERELLISGTCGECFDTMFGEPDDEGEPDYYPGPDVFEQQVANQQLKR